MLRQIRRAHAKNAVGLHRGARAGVLLTHGLEQADLPPPSDQGHRPRQPPNSHLAPQNTHQALRALRAQANIGRAGVG